MPGPPPKPPEARRTRHTPRAGEWRTAESTGWQHGKTPPAPTGLGADAKRAWIMWLSSWVASFWTPADVPGLRIVARLYDLAIKEPKAANATALGQWMDRYGLTHRGRQQLRWRPSADEAPEPKRNGGGNPYAHLKVVGEPRPHRKQKVEPE